VPAVSGLLHRKYLGVEGEMSLQNERRGHHVNGEGQRKSGEHDQKVAHPSSIRKFYKIVAVGYLGLSK
jgi:hypothetical protein